MASNNCASQKDVQRKCHKTNNLQWTAKKQDNITKSLNVSHLPRLLAKPSNSAVAEILNVLQQNDLRPAGKQSQTACPKASVMTTEKPTTIIVVKPTTLPNGKQAFIKIPVHTIEQVQHVRIEDSTPKVHKQTLNVINATDTTQGADILDELLIKDTTRQPDQQVEEQTLEVIPVIPDNLEQSESGSSDIIQQISPVIRDFEVTSHQLQDGEDIADLSCTMFESNLGGYGPECIAGEMEVVAAETHDLHTSPVVVRTEISSPRRRAVTEQGMLGEGDDIEVVTLPHAGVTNSSHPSGANLVPCLTSDGTLTLATMPSHIDLPGEMVPIWMKREWKRARDRAKKRSKRADPDFRKRERQEALSRMKNKRADPTYRERERERDRERRRVARLANPDQRQKERERDKLYRKKSHKNKGEPRTMDGLAFVDSVPQSTEEVIVNIGSLV